MAEEIVVSGIRLDTRRLEAGSRRSRRELDRLEREAEQVERSFRGADRQADNLSRGLDKVGREARQTDSQFAGLKGAVGAFSVAVAASMALDYGRRLIEWSVAAFELGAAIEETESKFLTVFGESSDALDAFIADFGRLAGLTESEGRNIVATAGSIAQGFGFAREESAEFAEAIVRLAGDFASFQNADIEDTFRAIKSAVVGQFEPLDNLGVVLRKADIDARALIDTGKDQVSQLTQQERATATLALITERMGVQLGDLERTQDSAANSSRRMARDYRQVKEDLAVVVKDALLPVQDALADLAAFLNENRTAIRNWSRAVVTFVSEALAALGDAFDRYIAILRLASAIGELDFAQAKDAIEDYAQTFEDGFARTRRSLDAWKTAIEGVDAETEEALAALEGMAPMGPTLEQLGIAGTSAAGGISAAGSAASGAASEMRRLKEATDEALAAFEKISAARFDVRAGFAKGFDFDEIEFEIPTVVVDPVTQRRVPAPPEGFEPRTPGGEVTPPTPFEEQFGGVESMEERLEREREAAEAAARATDQLNQALETLAFETIVDVIRGTEDLGDAFLDFVLGALRSLARAQQQGFEGNILDLILGAGTITASTPGGPGGFDLTGAGSFPIAGSGPSTPITAPPPSFSVNLSGAVPMTPSPASAGHSSPVPSFSMPPINVSVVATDSQSFVEASEEISGAIAGGVALQAQRSSVIRRAISGR